MEKTNPAQNALRMLDEQRKALGGIVAEAARLPNSTAPREKLLKWKDRTADLLGLIVHPREGERLQDMKGSPWYVFSSIKSEVNADALKYDGFLEALEETVRTHPNDILASLTGTKPGETAGKPDKRVYLVHGHDGPLKQAVVRTLEQLGLTPVVLREQPGQSGTIIEEVTEYSDVSCVIVMLSPDELGFSRKDGPEAAKPRDRQGVIFELGYLVGKLGSQAVIALPPREPAFELPTDYSGVVFIPLDADDGWRYSLVKALQAIGLNVDANQLARPD
jgi:predicted nucleotide-binding protein